MDLECARPACQGLRSEHPWQESSFGGKEVSCVLDLSWALQGVEQHPWSDAPSRWDCPVEVSCLRKSAFEAWFPPSVSRLSALGARTWIRAAWTTARLAVRLGAVPLDPYLVADNVAEPPWWSRLRLRRVKGPGQGHSWHG